MTLIVDVETVPLASALAAPYPEADRSPPSNYKNADAIERWRETDRAAWAAARVKECSLNPRLGRIVALGVNGAVFAACAEPDEEKVLAEFWEQVSEHRGNVVTFNGSFDLRFIVTRTLAHRLKPSLPPRIIRDWFARYRVSPHYDCRGVLTNWDRFDPGTLADWASFLGVETSDPHSGADVFELYQAGDFDAIANHCRADLALTDAIYERLQPMFGCVEG